LTCPCRFTPGKDPVPIVQEAGWATGLVWTCAKNFAPTGIRSPDRPAHYGGLTAIDRYTRWPEAHPLSEITAEAVAKAFVYIWVDRFGCHQQITTDQGKQFEANPDYCMASDLQRFGREAAP
jgi:hypothetical protein